MYHNSRHAPVEPGGLAGSGQHQDAAAHTAAAAGGLAISEAPLMQHEQPSRPTPSTSTETSEAVRVDEASGRVSNADATDVADRPEVLDRSDTSNDDDAQPPPASPAVTPPLSSAALSQSLVLIVAHGASSPASPASPASPSRTSSSRSATPLPTDQTQRRVPSPRLREGTLVVRTSSRAPPSPPSLDDLPNEVLLHILGYLDVNDLLATSRTSHHLRCLAVAPILHTLRRRHIRAALPPLLDSPMRPSLADLIRRHIFLTNTTVVSRKLTRSLVSIRLSRRLAARPPVHVLVERCVLPPECAPGIGHVAPALAARTRAIEREKVKDGLRRWVGAVWQREVGRRSERIRKCDESLGVGKVWRLRKFWERVSHGN